MISILMQLIFASPFTKEKVYSSSPYHASLRRSLGISTTYSISDFHLISISISLFMNKLGYWPPS